VIVDIQTNSDTEDKDWWVQEGAKREILFVEQIAPKLGLIAEINPEKQENPYAPDLIVNGRLADLKSQTTPFYLSYMYGVPSQYSATFNEKDYRRYKRFYPDLDIYFWLSWDKSVATLNRIIHVVRPVDDVWVANFQQIENSIQWGAAKHEYANRKNDTNGNARSSYILDMRWFFHVESRDYANKT
jgi:hypothetical protein